MVFPAVMAGLALAGTAISGSYDVAKALETRRYWDDYQRHTGVRVRYPYRVGYNDVYKASGRALQSFGGYGTIAYGRFMSPRTAPYHSFGSRSYDPMYN